MTALVRRTPRAEVVAVLDQLGDVLDDLDPLARTFTALVSKRSGRGAGREDLVELRAPIFDLLDAHRSRVAGAGAVVRPGLLAGTPRWLEWWWLRAGGRPEQLRVNLDESAADFFDYTSAEWYAAPAASGRRHAAGPYVDHLCTNEYSITLTAPVHAGGELIGVVGADVLVSALESRLVPPLRRIGPDTVLVTAAGRVVASATPALAPGHRLPPDVARGGVLRTRQAVDGLGGWRLARAPSP